MIREEDVSKILDATQILDVVSSFVDLKKRGVNYLGLCPFHNEKTPSFTVSPAKGIFKCFGCGEGGNAIYFLMKHEHYSYVEALRHLADKYGIEIREVELSSEEKQKRSRRESLYHITDFAEKYFTQLLFEDQEGRNIGLSYFRERGLEEKTIKKWSLGYAKDDFRNFTDHAQMNGYPNEDLVNSGLSIYNEERDSYYDRFRGRIIFPIFNIGGRALGFTARTLSDQKNIPKYVNSPETEIYSKSNVLFGLNLAKNEIVKQDLCYLVEGNMDAIMLSQNDVENVVATSGTALTQQQIRLLKRYTQNITILFDGDSAGIKAAFRAIDLFLENGMNVKVVLFPEGHDPDSYSRLLPQDEFKSYIVDNAENFIIYKTNLLLEDAKDDPIKRAELIKEIVSSISLIPDHIQRATYIQECSSLLNIKEEILNNELNRKIRDNYYESRKKEERERDARSRETQREIIKSLPKSQDKQHLDSPHPDEAQEKAIISLLLNFGDRMTKQMINDEEEEYLVAAYLVGDIHNDDIGFDNKVYQKIFDIYKDSLFESGELPNPHAITNNEEEEIRKVSTELMINNYKISELWMEKWGIRVPCPEDEEVVNKAVKECLYSLKLNKLERKIQKIKEEIKKEEDEDNLLILISQQNSFLKVKKIIAAELNRIIT